MNTTTIICDYESYTEDICAIRYEVFIDEQNVPEELEIDGLDGEAKHVLAFVDEVSIGTGRILSDGHIGRVAVLKNYRGLGIGKLIMKELIKWAQDLSIKKVWLSSQWHAHSFYLDLGFICDGEIYKEAGIDHIKMYRLL
ncbi:MAG: GNAT family N-acetyltransferase [Woeseiaceae bacterium]|nr:GNAT family N-acetyltransferase [Woeseiaceae bacterium]